VPFRITESETIRAKSPDDHWPPRAIPGAATNVSFEDQAGRRELVGI